MNIEKAKITILACYDYSSIIGESIEIILRRDTVCNGILRCNIPAICLKILVISKTLENMTCSFHPFSLPCFYVMFSSVPSSHLSPFKMEAYALKLSVCYINKYICCVQCVCICF